MGRMVEPLSGPVGEVLIMLASAVGATLFTIGGFLVEQAGINNVASGFTTIGLWETGIGALMLFVGVYLFGYQQCWYRLQKALL